MLLYSFVVVVVVVVELEVVIMDGSVHVEGTSVEVNENAGLSNPIECGVKPDVTNFNALLQWKHNTTNVVPLGVRSGGVYQVYENNMQRLYVKSAGSSANGLYSCEYVANNGSSLSQSFTLDVNGMTTRLL